MLNEEAKNVSQLKKIISNHHKYAVRTADATRSNNEPWDTFKPLDNETVMIIATYMLNTITVNA